MLALSIDAANDEPGIALSVNRTVAATHTWTTQQNHSIELLPAIDRLLIDAGRAKADIDAIFVDIGPGGYAALRVSVSIAKALAHALDVPLVGIGRLELDAYLVRAAAVERRIVPVHKAGRGDVAWAAYAVTREWHEELPPRITKRDVFYDALRPADVVTGDTDDEIAAKIAYAKASVAASDAHRVTALAALGELRLAAGISDQPASLVPLYLRAPAIGPQSSAAASSARTGTSDHTHGG